MGNTCYITRNTCNITRNTCNITRSTCNIKRNTCIITINTCNITRNTCDIKRNTCNITENNATLHESDETRNITRVRVRRPPSASASASASAEYTKPRYAVWLWVHALTAIGVYSNQTGNRPGRALRQTKTTFHLEYKFLLEKFDLWSLKFRIVDLITSASSMSSQIPTDVVGSRPSDKHSP